jgi:hypothetical protein
MKLRLTLVVSLFAWPAIAAEPIRQVGVYVQPFYEAAREPGGKPRVSVGKQYNDLLSSNRREDILAARDSIAPPLRRSDRSGSVRAQLRGYRQTDRSRRCRPSEDFAQVGHAATDAATEIKHRFDRADQLMRQFDLVASEVAAIAIEEFRLRGDDRLVLTGILIEVGRATRSPSCPDRDTLAGQPKFTVRPACPSRRIREQK